MVSAMDSNNTTIEINDLKDNVEIQKENLKNDSGIDTNKLSSDYDVSSFTDFKNALNDASITTQDEYVINLTSSFNSTSPVEWSSNNTILVVDGNGFNITGSGYHCFITTKTETTVVLKNVTLNSFNSYYIPIINSDGNLSLDSVTIKNSRLYYNTTAGVIFSNGTLYVNNSTFINNKAYYGAGVYLGSNANATITNSIFSNNNVTYNGAGIYNKGLLNLTNNNFSKNSAVRGGAILSSNTGILYNNTFISNKASYGGAIFLNNTSMNFTANQFKNNIVNTSGGAIYSNSSNVRIKEDKYVNNTAKIGGAIVFIDKKILLIADSEFTNNSAKYNGGAIHTIYPAFNITSSAFTSNKANQSGGALSLELVGYGLSKYAFINNSLFENNSARHNGSSIYSLMGNITLNNSIIVNNDVNDICSDDYNFIINKNWWGLNNPDFNQRTYGMIPDTWRIMKVGSNNVGDYKELTISLTTLNDGTTTNNPIMNRTILFNSTSGSFAHKTLNISSNVTNTYTGSSDNITATIDRQTLIFNDKIEPYFTASNITAQAGNKINLTGKINNNITQDIKIKINNQEFTTTANNGVFKLTYDVLSNMSGSYTVYYTYAGDNYYKSKTINSTLYVKSKENNVTITSKMQTLVNDTKDDLPASFDLRDYNFVTPVKNQQTSGSCWSFGMISSLESALLKYECNSTYDFSENSVKNSIKYYSLYGDLDKPNTGATATEALFAIVDWNNVAYEVDDPYDDLSDFSVYLDKVYHVQDVIVIESKRTDFTNNTAIKEALMKYGVLSASYYYSNNYYLRPAYYINTTTSTNHRVSIVGWDDNYDKSNFKNGSPGNGAFIIKNSWGTSYGDNGYDYISYYDTSLSNIYATIINTTQQYDNCYQYEHVSTYIRRYSGRDTVYAKNIYTAQKHESIAAVGSYFRSVADYNISIVVNGVTQYTQEGRTNEIGYKTIRLNNYVDVYKGDKFEVILSLKTLNGSTAEVTTQRVTDFRAILPTNASFLSANGMGWTDLATLNETACIRAYTVDTVELNTTVTCGKTIEITTDITNVNQGGVVKYLLNGEYLTDSDGETIAVTPTDNIAKLSYTLNSKLNDNFTITTVYETDYYTAVQNNDFEWIENLFEIEITANDTKIGIPTTIKGFILNTTDSTGVNALNMGIYVNQELIEIVTTNSEGYFELNYTPTKIIEHNITINFTYDESKYSQKAYFNVSKQNTKIEIILNDTTPKIGNNITITAVVTNENNQNLTDANVTLKINKVLYSLKTENGKIQYNYTINTIGTNNISLTYAGNDSYNNSTKQITFATLKRNTTLTLNATNVKYGKNTLINGTLLDEYNTPLTNQTIKLTIENILTTYLKTDTNGIFTYNYTAKSIGTFNITVTFDETTNYTSSTKNTTFNVTKTTYNLNVSIENVTIGQNTHITGKLYDENGNITNALLNITINNNEKLTTKTDENGEYSYTYIPNTIGQNNLTIQYINENYNENIIENTFNVEKIKTSILISQINDTYIKHNVTIIAKLVDENQTIISGEEVKIRFNNIKYPITTTSNGFDYTNQTNIIGTNNITISYEGSNRYGESEENIIFNVLLVNTKLNLEVNDTVLNKTTQVYIKLEDMYDNPVAENQITLKFNDDEEIKLNTLADGTITYDYTPNKTGLNTIKIEYKGSDVYNNSSTQASFNVSKISTKLSVDVNDTVLNSLTKVFIKLEDVNSNNIANTKVVLVFNDGENITVDTNGGGVTTYDYLTIMGGLNTLKVIYDGDDSYYNNSTQISFNVSKINTVLSVDVNDTVLNQTTLIYATIKDSDNNPIKNANIILIFNDESNITFVSDDNGVISHNYLTNTTGLNTLKVVYEGNGSYNNYSTQKSFNVSKINTKLIVDVNNTVLNQTTTVYATLKDSYNNPISDATIVLMFNDESNVTRVTSGDGSVSYDYLAGTTGLNTLKVVYVGNESYNNFSTQKSFNVSKISTTISVNVNDTILNQTTKVEITLKDSNGLGVANATLILVFNDGDNITVVTDDGGVVTYDYLANSSGLNTLKIEYAGNDSYNNSSTQESFNVSKIGTNISVDVNDTMFNQTTPVVITLKDLNDKSITNATLVLIFNDGENITAITDDTGVVTYDYLANTTGLNTLNVIYDGNDSYNNSTTQTVFVSRINTILTVDVNDTALNQTTTVYVTLKDSNNNPVNNTAVVLIFNDKNNVTVVTNTDGVATHTYLANTTGLNTLKAIFDTNNNYNSSNTQTTFNVSKIKTKLILNVGNTTLTSNTTISGILTDANNNILTNKTLKIFINNALVKTTQTKATGGYSYEYTPESEGQKEVKIVFEETEIYESVEITTTFNVIKEHSVLEITIDNPKINNITINGILKTDNGLRINNAPIKIKLNNNTVSTNTDENGSFNYVFNKTTSGINNISVSYDLNETYYPTTYNTSISLTKISTNIQVSAGNVEVNKTVNIVGWLYDEDTRAIKDANITLIINNATYNVKTDNEGVFKYNYTANLLNQNNITVIYEENNIYLESRNNTTFIVNIIKLNTTISLDVQNITYNQKSIITGILKNQLNNTISNANVSLIINGLNKTTLRTDSNGQFKYNYTPTANTQKVYIQVIFDGNGTLEATSTLKQISVNKILTNITITNITNIIGTNNITGYITNAIKTVIELTINKNKTILFITDNTGKFNTTFNITKIGSNNITLKYYGNTTHNPSTTSRIINTPRPKTITTVDSINARLNDTVNLTAHVLDENNNPVSDGIVTFMINNTILKYSNGSQVTAKVNNGLARVSYKVQTSWLGSTTQLSAVFNSTTMANSTSKKVNLTINKHNASVQLLMDYGPFKSGETITFRLIVKEGDKLVSNGEVVFKLNGISLRDSKGNVIYAKVQDGVGMVRYTIPDGFLAANYTLTAVFGGGIYERYEKNNTLRVEKTLTHVESTVSKTSTNTIRVSARILDGTNNHISYISQVTIKLNGVSVVKGVNVSNGVINITFTFKLAQGLYNLLIIAGENHAYTASQTTSYLIRT